MLQQVKSIFTTITLGRLSGADAFVFFCYIHEYMPLLLLSFIYIQKICMLYYSLVVVCVCDVHLTFLDLKTEDKNRYLF